MLKNLLPVLPILLFPISTWAAFDGDLSPRLVNNMIVTDGISDEDGSTASDVTVFQYTLGDLAPAYTMDPGFQPFVTSNLPGNTFLGFNTTTSLVYWNGSGAPAFTPAPQHSQLELYLGGARLFISNNSGAQTGFVLQQLEPDGSGHRHLNAQFLGAADPSGTFFDDQGNTYDAPSSGIYALGITVTDAAGLTTDPSDYHSLTKWLVYNNNLSDSQLTAAADILGLPGDATLDGKVDLSDLSVVLNNFGKATNAWTDGNFDTQPTIDLTDLSDVLNGFGQSLSAPASPAVSAPAPEPMTLLPLGFGLVFLLIGRTAHRKRGRNTGVLSPSY